jgi:hypothetical protein
MCRDWIIDTFDRAGFEIDMGGKLLSTYLAAGLPPPQMTVSGRVGGGVQSPVYDHLAGVLRSLLPVAERHGVATASDVEIDTLADRLRSEAIAHRACIMSPVFISAWTCMPV